MQKFEDLLKRAMGECKKWIYIIVNYNMKTESIDDFPTQPAKERECKVQYK